MSREELHAALRALGEEIDDEVNVPERFETTAKGQLAETDAEILRLAAIVVHRLLLWERFPTVSPESYFARQEVIASRHAEFHEPIASRKAPDVVEAHELRPVK